MAAEAQLSAAQGASAAQPLLPVHLQAAVHRALSDLQAQRLLYPQQCAAAEELGCCDREQAERWAGHPVAALTILLMRWPACTTATACQVSRRGSRALSFRPLLTQAHAGRPRWWVWLRRRPIRAGRCAQSIQGPGAAMEQEKRRSGGRGGSGGLVGAAAAASAGSSPEARVRYVEQVHRSRPYSK
jgi:hypothetical protein